MINPMVERTRSMVDVMNAWISGEQIQYRAIGRVTWLDLDNPNWCWDTTEYRTKPKTPDKFNWDSVNKKYNWYARDKSGLAYFYSTMPVIERGQWRFPAGSSVGPKPSVFSSAGALSIELGACSWENSLQSRPGVI